MRRLAASLDHAAFIIERNAKRLLVLFGVGAVLVTLFGARELAEGIAGFLGSAPGFAILLILNVVLGISYFLGIMWFLSRPRKYVVTPDDPQIGLSFDNYRGQPDLLEHAKSLVRILQGVERFKQHGGEMPRGMLLSGKPGTGKTFLAGCIAAEAKLPFIYMDASAMTSMWFGVDALIVWQLFRQARGLARKYAPKGSPGACIVFLDELDSIGITRGAVMGGQQQAGALGGLFGYGRFALNTLLNQMDSLGQHVEDRWSRRILRWLGLIRGPVPPRPTVFVIGATNRPEVLDPALTRPGRLDRHLVVHPPDAEGRRDIIEHYLAQKSHDPEIPVELMVADSIGWTPVEIKTVINEALIIAHDHGRDALTYADWLDARDARFLGIKQPIRRFHVEDRRAVAYHEAGHAVVRRYVDDQKRIIKASIIRRGDTLGVVQPSPKEERYTTHARDIENDIMVSLGSRAVEELILGTKMTGAASDLQAATARAINYVANFGMGSSLIAVPASPMSGVPEPVLRLADELLAELYEETKRLVRAKEHAVHAVAEALIERDELIGDELEAVFAAADAAHPDRAQPFERSPVVLPRLFERTKDVVRP
ncbi:MAG TPA: AAA family ATPase, partial [Candidatus Limnocylindrales bacterium]|nr:AAA family ATPase [Candidatus Limnocylindrales bacterium]